MHGHAIIIPSNTLLLCTGNFFNEIFACLHVLCRDSLKFIIFFSLLCMNVYSYLPCLHVLCRNAFKFIVHYVLLSG